MQIIENHSLKEHNTFGLEARCRYFIEIHSVEILRKALKSTVVAENNLYVLGGGSNVLFTQDFDGVILKISIPGIYVVKEDPDFYWVKVGAGVAWHELVTASIRANFGGLENLALIPGTVGAAPIQNIGAYGREICQVLEGVEAYHIKTGEKRYFRNEECKFGYRDSVFKNALKGVYVITHIALRLTKNHVIDVTYGALKDKLKGRDASEISIETVSNTVIDIRKSKLPDPALLGNAGSFFKNPIIGQQDFKPLKERFPDLPGFPVNEHEMKIPAAWLIDQAGWKGKQFGGAAIHEAQPLVIVNRGAATGKDILKLAEAVQRSVKSLFGITLAPEVQIL